MRRRMADALAPLGYRAHDKRRGAPLLPRGAGRRADADRVQPVGALGRARHRSRGRRDPLAPSMRSRSDGGLAVLFGNLAPEGCIVKTAGVDEQHPDLQRQRAGLREPGRRRGRHPRQPGQAGRRGGDPLRRPQGRARHAGDAVSDQLSEIEGPGQGLRAGHRRPLLGRQLRACRSAMSRRKRPKAD